MPDSIYLNKDEKYNTIGIHTAYGENYLLAENEFDEKCLEYYVEYTPIYRLEEEKQKLIDKACEWLSHRIFNCGEDNLINDFKKAMAKGGEE